MGKKSGIIDGIKEAIFPLFVYYLVSNLLQIVGLTYLESIRESVPFSMGKGEGFLIVRGVVLMTSFFLTTLCVFPYYQKEKVFFAKERKGLKKEWILIPVAAAVLAIGCNYLWSFLPFFRENEAYEAVAKHQYSYPLWLGLLLYGLAAPLAEEVMFRGILYPIFRRTSGIIFGILLSSFLFGVFHGNVVQASYGMVMGVIMAYVYEKYGTLKAPLLFHSGANVAIYMLQNILK